MCVQILFPCLNSVPETASTALCKCLCVCMCIHQGKTVYTLSHAGLPLPPKMAACLDHALHSCCSLERGLSCATKASELCFFPSMASSNADQGEGKTATRCSPRVGCLWSLLRGRTQHDTRQRGCSLPSLFYSSTDATSTETGLLRLREFHPTPTPTPFIAPFAGSLQTCLCVVFLCLENLQALFPSWLSSG